MADWSTLPEGVLFMIAVRLFSLVELLRFRSICKAWRSSVSGDDLFPRRPLIHLDSLLVKLCITPDGNEQISSLDYDAFLSRSLFFRVTPISSLSPSQSWLIKSDTDLRSGSLRLLNPLSRRLHPYHRYHHTLDLLRFTVSQIKDAYTIGDLRMRETVPGFKRLLLVSVSGGGNPKIVGIGLDKKIRYWNGEIWTRINDQTAQFTDIIVHRGLTYALDSKGIVWLISPSLSSIFRYGPSLDQNIITHRSASSYKTFVECCGELYIVDRLYEKKPPRRSHIPLNDLPRYPSFGYTIHDNVDNVFLHPSEFSLPEDLNPPKTVGFKVYKMDKELEKWVEIKSLGDNAFLMATDCSFSVLALDFYGCLKNSIYFTDQEYEILVFKLDDASITGVERVEQSCFQMFLPCFT